MNSIIYASNDDITKNSLYIYYSDETFGVSIIETKYTKRKKYLGWEHILLKKNTFKHFLIALDYKEEDSFFSCSCGSEILRLMYDKDDNMFYIMIYDNYFLKCPKQIRQDIYISPQEVENLLLLREYL